MSAALASLLQQAGLQRAALTGTYLALWESLLASDTALHALLAAMGWDRGVELAQARAWFLAGAFRDGQPPIEVWARGGADEVRRAIDAAVHGLPA